jgi:hypothetical protein
MPPMLSPDGAIINKPAACLLPACCNNLQTHGALARVSNGAEVHTDAIILQVQPAYCHECGDEQTCICRTALHKALYCGHLQIAALLLQHNAGTYVQDYKV